MEKDIQSSDKEINICEVCGKEWKWAIRTHTDYYGNRTCVHDQLEKPIQRIYKSYEQQKEYFNKKENPFKKVLYPK